MPEDLERAVLSVFRRCEETRSRSRVPHAQEYPGYLQWIVDLRTGRTQSGPAVGHTVGFSVIACLTLNIQRSASICSTHWLHYRSPRSPTVGRRRLVPTLRVLSGIFANFLLVPNYL